MSRPKWTCQSCGVEGDPEVIAEMATYHGGEQWMIHRVEQKGGYVQIMACPKCSSMTEPTVLLDSYKKRIREGLVPGIH